jgi:uncharacterized protein YqfA (UPF0365 family)
MHSYTRSFAATILTVCCYLSIPTVDVVAQSPSPGPSTDASNLSNLSDQKLNAAAALLRRAALLQKDYRQRIEDAPAEMESIVAEVHEEFTKAVIEQGLSVEEYASILDAARDDPKIHDEILMRLRSSDK